MVMNCDAVVVLPGGAGSLDEMFEVLTWRQLGLHEKPVVLVNTHGYWDPLVALVDHVIGAGFADADLRDYFTVAQDADAAFAILSWAAIDAVSNLFYTPKRKQRPRRGAVSVERVSRSNRFLRIRSLAHRREATFSQFTRLSRKFDR